MITFTIPQLSAALGRLTLLRGAAGFFSPILVEKLSFAAPVVSFGLFAVSSLLFVLPPNLFD